MSYDINSLSPMKKFWLLKNSNIPRRFLGFGPEDTEEKSGPFPGVLDAWIDDVLEGKIIKGVGNIGTTGVGLLFDGSPGIGKTTHAVVAAMEVVKRIPEEDIARVFHYDQSQVGHTIRPIYYTTYPEFLSKKKSTFDAAPEDRREMNYELDGLHGRSKFDWLNVRILIIDDLGKEYGSKYDDTSFDEILRIRYDKGLPTIVTTNVLLDQWADKYGEAMGSFANEAFIKVNMIGDDKRL
jgi:DNA replication protein DnaC